MKQVLFNIFIILAFSLEARNLPEGFLKLVRDKKAGVTFSRANLEKPILDSASFYVWDEKTQKYEQNLYVFTKWNNFGSPVSWQMFSLDDSKRQEIQKLETEGVDQGDETVYTSLVYDWDTASQSWSNNGKRTDRFTKDGLKYYWEDYAKMEQTGEWYQSGRNDFEYDTNGNQTLQLIYGLFSNGDLKPSSRHEHTYNSYNEETSYLVSDWDFTIEKWVVRTKEIHTFDSIGKPSNDSTFNKSNGQLKLGNRNEYLYDSLGRLAIVKSYSNQVGPILQFSEQNSYFYDVAQKANVTVVTSSVILDSLGKPVFKDSFKDMRVLNSDGNIILSIMYEWDNGKETWNLYEKTEYAYFEGGIPSKIISHWDEDLNDWKIGYFEKYYYRTNTVGINDQTIKTNPSFYPNPAHEIIMLNEKEPLIYSIYNLEGRIMQTGNSMLIDLKGLYNGTYVLNIKSGNMTNSQRFTKE